MKKIMARALLVPTLFVSSAGLLLAQQDSNSASPAPATTPKLTSGTATPTNPRPTSRKKTHLTGSSRHRSGGPL